MFPVILLRVVFDPPRLRVPAAVFFVIRELARLFVALPVARFVVLARFVVVLARLVVPVLARFAPMLRVVPVARFAAPVVRVPPVARFAVVPRVLAVRFGDDAAGFVVRDLVVPVARFVAVVFADARRVRAIPILLRWGRGQDTFPIRTILHTPLSEPLR